MITFLKNDRKIELDVDRKYNRLETLRVQKKNFHYNH